MSTYKNKYVQGNFGKALIVSFYVNPCHLSRTQQ